MSVTTAVQQQTPISMRSGWYVLGNGKKVRIQLADPILMHSECTILVYVSGEQ